MNNIAPFHQTTKGLEVIHELYFLREFNLTYRKHLVEEVCDHEPFWNVNVHCHKPVFDLFNLCT